jgi:hypothetical protein
MCSQVFQASDGMLEILIVDDKLLSRWGSCSLFVATQAVGFSISCAWLCFRVTLGISLVVVALPKRRLAALLFQANLWYPVLRCEGYYHVFLSSLKLCTAKMELAPRDEACCDIIHSFHSRQQTQHALPQLLRVCYQALNDLLKRILVSQRAFHAFLPVLKHFVGPDLQALQSPNMLF